MILELPTVIIELVLSNLDVIDLKCFFLVCRQCANRNRRFLYSSYWKNTSIPLQTKLATVKRGQDAIQTLINDNLTKARDTVLKEVISKMEFPPVKKLTLCRTFIGHTERVFYAAWAPDSSFVVSTSFENRVLIWHPYKNKLISSFSHTTFKHLSCDVSPTKELVLITDIDCDFKVYRLNGNQRTHYIGHSGYTNKIITASGDRTCMLWDIAKSDSPLIKFSEVEHEIPSVHTLIGKEYFVSGSMKLIHLWDQRIGNTAVRVFPLSAVGDCDCVRFSSNGVVFAAGGGNAIEIFDIRSAGNIVEYTFPDGYGCLNSIDFSKSGRILFCGTPACHAIDTLKGEVIYSLDKMNESNVSCVRVSPDGYSLLTTSWNTNINLYTSPKSK